MVCLICGTFITNDMTLRIQNKQVYKEFFDILVLDIKKYNEELNSFVYQSFCNKCCSELNHISRVLAAFKLLEEEIEKFKANLKNQLVRTHEEQSKIKTRKDEKWRKNVQNIRRKVCNDLELLPNGNTVESTPGIGYLIPNSQIEIIDIKSCIEFNLDDENDDNDPYFDDDTSPDYEPKENFHQGPISSKKLKAITQQNEQRLKEDALKNRFVLKIKKVEDMTLDEIKVQLYLASLRSKTPFRKPHAESGIDFDSDDSNSPKSPNVVNNCLYPPEKYKVYKSGSFRPGDPCSVCGEKFDRVGDLNDHLFRAHNNEIIACPACPKMFKYRFSMRRHFDYHHKDIPKPVYKRMKTYVKPEFKPGTPCIVCREKFDTKELLNEHYSKVHDNKIYECQICSKCFKVRTSLRRHMTEVHLEEKNKILAEREMEKELKKNREKTHSLCPICGSSVLYLRTHMLIHKEVERIPVKCNVCDKTLISQRSYTRHYRLFHSKTSKDFMCQRCGKTFGSNYKLRTHEDIVHLDNGKFHCELCPKKFESNWKLKTHMGAKHDGVTYQCNFDNCEKSYQDVRQLKFHKMNHTGERPCVCSFCNKGFKRKKDLDIHETTHTPHVTRCACEICGKKFTHKNYLTLHLFHHKKIEEKQNLGKTPVIRKRKRKNPKTIEVENQNSQKGLSEEKIQFYCNTTGANNVYNVIEEPVLEHVNL